MSEPVEPIESIKAVIEDECKAIGGLISQINSSYQEFVEVLLTCKGTLIVSGLGKSGIIATKIAATMSSLGTRSYFLHASDALHGDLGMMSQDDVLLALSFSGETEEILQLIAGAQARGIMIVSMTGNVNSTLSKKSNISLSIAIENEACHLNVAPTSSTTAMLVIGDAIAVTVSKLKKFGLHDFAFSHPSGSLGRRLLNKVRDVIQLELGPFVNPEDNFMNILAGVTQSNLGAVMVIDEQRCVGLITDGDVRRCLQQNGRNVFDLTARDFMTKNPIVINVDDSLDLAYQAMNKHSITNVIAVDQHGHAVGMLNIHSLL